MLMKAKDIIGRKLTGADGDVGRVKDVYFHDDDWRIRYVVVDTGGWLDRNEVLLAPGAITQWSADALHTALTREKVENSPPVVSDMPLSRQYEQRLHEYYGWTPYWTYPILPSPGFYVFPTAPVPPPSQPAEVIEAERARAAQENDPHLRSFSEIKGYHIKADDGEIGHVADLLLDLDAFRITHLVVDTRNWLPGRHVVVDVGIVRSISWENSNVVAACARQAIKDAPEYRPEEPIDEPYQSQLSSYYRGIGDVTSPRVGL